MYNEGKKEEGCFYIWRRVEEREGGERTEEEDVGVWFWWMEYMQEGL